MLTERNKIQRWKVKWGEGTRGCGPHHQGRFKHLPHPECWRWLAVHEGPRPDKQMKVKKPSFHQTVSQRVSHEQINELLRN